MITSQLPSLRYPIFLLVYLYVLQVKNKKFLSLSWSYLFLHVLVPFSPLILTSFYPEQHLLLRG